MLMILRLDKDALERFVFPAGIVAVALLIRSVYLYQIFGTPLDNAAYTGESPMHLDAMQSILDGNFSEIAASPLHVIYEFFAAALFGAFKIGVFSVRVAQILLDCLTAALILRLSRQLGLNRDAGLLAATVYAFYGIAVFYSPLILDAAFTTFLCAALMSAALSAPPRLKNPALLIFGALAVLAPAAIGRHEGGSVMNAVLFWNGAEPPDGISYEISKKLAPLFLWPFFSFALLAPFGLAGLVLGIVKKRTQLYPAVIFTFFYWAAAAAGAAMTDRFRLPCIPVISILGAYAVSELLSALKPLSVKRAAAILLLLGAAALFTRIDLTAAADEKLPPSVLTRPVSETTL